MNEHHFGATPRTDLYIPFEIESRELDGAVLLAAKALEYGFRPLIGGRYSVHRAIVRRRTRNAILLYKGDLPHDLIIRYMCYISHFCVLDQELGPTIRYDPEVIRGRICGQIPLGVSRFFTVGPTAQRAAQEVYGDNAVMTGWPRFEIATRIRRSDLDHGQGGRVWKRPFVLFASSQYLSRQIIEELMTEDRSNQASDLIVRPHPSDVTSDFSLLEDESRRVFVRRDRDSFSWVRNSVGVIHTGSTVGLDALLVGIPTVGLHPDIALHEPSDTVFLPGDEMELNNPFSHTGYARSLSAAMEVLLGKTPPDIARARDLLSGIIYLSKAGASDEISRSLAELSIDSGKSYRLHRLQDTIPEVSYSGIRGTLLRMTVGRSSKWVKRRNPNFFTKETSVPTTTKVKESLTKLGLDEVKGVTAEYGLVELQSL